MPAPECLRDDDIVAVFCPLDKKTEEMNDAFCALNARKNMEGVPPSGVILRAVSLFLPVSPGEQERSGRYIYFSPVDI